MDVNGPSGIINNIPNAYQNPTELKTPAEEVQNLQSQKEENVREQFGLAALNKENENQPVANIIDLLV